jgi:hypothetical protein
VDVAVLGQAVKSEVAPHNYSRICYQIVFDRLKVPTENPVSAPHVEPLGIFIHVPPDRPTVNFLIPHEIRED